MEYANFAALFIGVALVPGIPADGMYGYICGVDRRERVFAYLLRIFLFSTVGLLAIALLSIATGYRVVHALILDARSFSATNPEAVLLLYLGQFLFALAIGALSAFVITRRDLVVRVTWDRFIKSDIQNHWVVVTLVSGESYLGFIKGADVEAAETDRDVLLGEPAIYEASAGQYRTLPYTSLFLKAKLISAVAVVYNPQLDRATRVTPVDVSAKDD